jgi:hypothetical protein
LKDHNNVSRNDCRFSTEFLVIYFDPFISGFIGYVTKVIAIQMMFAPLEFKGIIWSFWLARYRPSKS